MSSRIRTFNLRRGAWPIMVLALVAVLLLPAMVSAQSDDLGDPGKQVNHLNNELRIRTKTSNGANIPDGAGWKLQRWVGGLNYADIETYTYNSASTDNDRQDREDINDGFYRILGNDVPGWTYSYDDQSDHLSEHDTEEIGLTYSPIKKVFVNTYATLNGNPVNIPNGAGWKLKQNTPGSDPTRIDATFNGSQSSPDQKVWDDGGNGAQPDDYYIDDVLSVPGWTYSVDDYTENLSGSEDSETFHVRYFRKVGDIIVRTENSGGGNLPPGSGWHLIGPGDFPGENKNTSNLASVDEVTLEDVPYGIYTVTAYNVYGWGITFSNSDGRSPNNTTDLGSVSDDSEDTLTVTYTRQYGKLNINIGAGAPAGAGWDITSAPADYSGSGDGTANYSNASAEAGYYTVTGQAVAGWSFDVTVAGGDPLAPAPAAASASRGLPGGGEVTFTVTYTRQTGSLQVIVQNNSGATYALPGSAGWVITSHPSDYSGNTSGSAGYGPISAETGTYVLEANAVTGWSRGVAVSISNNVAPSAASQEADLSAGGGVTFTVSYTRLVGTLSIVLSNGSAGTYSNPAGWGWDITYAPTDYPGAKPTSGNATHSDNTAPTGEYFVDGKAVTGWTYSIGVTDIGPGVAPADPAGSHGSLPNGGFLTYTITYTRQVGRLVIDLVNASSPTYSDPAGWGWEITSDPGYPNSKTGNTNLSNANAPTGSYTVKGNAVTGWSRNVTVSGGNPPPVAPAAISASGDLGSEQTLTFTITYTRYTGNLIINVENGSSDDYPTLPSGAGWKITDKPEDYPAPPKPTQGDASGLNDPSAPTGEYTVTGKNIDHWRFYVQVDGEQPEVNTAAQQTSATGYLEEQLTFTVIYTRMVGELEIVTKTFDDRNLPVGAGWDITNHDPGDYIGDTQEMYNANEPSPQTWNDEDAATGEFTVTGKPVVGWTFNVTVEGEQQDRVSPSGQTESGELGEDGFLRFIVTYTINRYEVGAIYWDPVDAVQIPGGTITPGGAGVEHGANVAFTATTLPTNYELDGTASFTGTSGGSSVNIGTGVATFNNIQSNGTARLHVKLSLGELEVQIYPESVRPQAGWKMQGAGAFKMSWPNPEGVESLLPGFYDLEFKDVDGWNTPSPQFDVQITPNNKTIVVVNYTENPAGALQVFITDNLDERVNELGAQWQPIFSGGSKGVGAAGAWYNSGDIINGIEPGSVGLRFKTLAGWILPELGGATVEAGKTTRATGEYYRVLVIHKSDYNGDGTDDLATFDKSTGTWSVASIGKPSAVPGAVNLFEEKFGTDKDIPTSGDYDGDGIADLAYWRESTGEWRVNKQFKLKNFGEMQDIPVPGDYNGDGMTDAALFRPSTGEWIMYDVNTKKTTKVTFGGFGDVPVPGNYDADSAGMTDLAVFNVETRKWRVATFDANKNKWVERKTLKVNGKRIKIRVSHGEIGNVPVHADYDGDGATDLAVYVRGNSTWNVRDQFEIELGVKGDVPVPNDWAGLGRVIPTIFHPQNGRWISIDNLLRTKHGKGGQPLMSGR